MIQKEVAKQRGLEDLIVKFREEVNNYKETYKALVSERGALQKRISETVSEIDNYLNENCDRKHHGGRLDTIGGQYKPLRARKFIKYGTTPVFSLIYDRNGFSIGLKDKAYGLYYNSETQIENLLRSTGNIPEGKIDGLTKILFKLDDEKYTGKLETLSKIQNNINQTMKEIGYEIINSVKSKINYQNLEVMSYQNKNQYGTYKTANFTETMRFSFEKIGLPHTWTLTLKTKLSYETLFNNSKPAYLTVAIKRGNRTIYETQLSQQYKQTIKEIIKNIND